MGTIALNFKTNAKSTEGDITSLGGAIAGVAGVATKAFKAIAGGAVLAGGAITAMALASAKNQKELKNMSMLAGVSAREFQKLAFATDRYGISAEQLSDISKDVTEKLGEFAAAGSGGFTDFKDVMKITDKEARSLAVTLSGMPAPQALLEITKMMEANNVSRSQMSFVLESLGSDLTKLLPLLRDNGKEWASLSGQFDKATSKFALSTKMTSDLEDLSNSFDLTYASASAVSDYFSATLAPAITSSIDAITGALSEEGFEGSVKNASVALVEFGIFALDVLRPVVSVVQTLLDGFNQIGTSISMTVSAIGAFTGGIVGGASLDQAVGFAAEERDAAQDRGIAREKAISDIGGGATSGIDSLRSTLEKLTSEIEKSNSNQGNGLNSTLQSLNANSQVVRKVGGGN